MNSGEYADKRGIDFCAQQENRTHAKKCSSAGI